MSDWSEGMPFATVGVVGAGAWGTALAQVACRAGRVTTLWAREGAVVQSIATQGENSLFLPGVALHSSLQVTEDLARVALAEVVLIVSPAQFVRATLAALTPFLPAQTPLVLCAKGIEQESGLLVGEIAAQVDPGRPLAVLSGPTFAAEVAGGLPTAVTIACPQEALGRRLVATFGQAGFRCYWSADIIGAEIGGAVKNVLAVACGIAQGRGLGSNARAALMARGYAEMVRFGLAKGGRAETLAGLCGLGDLILTCSSVQSRNYALGVAVGEGATMAQALAGKTTVAEGAFTAPALVLAADRLGVEMPIVQTVHAILYEDAPVSEAIEALLARPFKAEQASL